MKGLTAEQAENIIEYFQLNGYSSSLYFDRQQLGSIDVQVIIPEQPPSKGVMIISSMAEAEALVKGISRRIGIFAGEAGVSLSLAAKYLEEKSVPHKCGHLSQKQEYGTPDSRMAWWMTRPCWQCAVTAQKIMGRFRYEYDYEAFRAFKKVRRLLNSPPNPARARKALIRELKRNEKRTRKVCKRGGYIMPTEEKDFLMNPDDHIIIKRLSESMRRDLWDWLSYGIGLTSLYKMLVECLLASYAVEDGVEIMKKEARKTIEMEEKWHKGAISLLKREGSPENPWWYPHLPALVGKE
jgi:hypothetical protein